MTAIALLAGGLIGIAIALLVRAVSLPRLRAAEQLDRIGDYGFASGESVSPVSERDGAIPRLGTAIAKRLGRERVRGVRGTLFSAGLHDLSVERYLGIHAVVIAGSTLLLTWFAAVTGASGGLAIVEIAFGAAWGWMLPRVALSRRARLRVEEIEREMPELVDLLLVGVESGMGFNGSARLASARIKGPLGEELQLMLQQQRLGASSVEALEALLERCDTPGTRSFVRTLVQGESLGVSISQMMRSLAVDLRKGRRAFAEEQAHKLPVKIVFPVTLTFLPALMIVVMAPVIIQLIDTF